MAKRMPRTEVSCIINKFVLFLTAQAVEIRQTRVRRAIGRRVRSLPYGYDTVYVSGIPYYYYDSEYYQEQPADDGSLSYVVVTEPEGAVVDDLPPVYGILEFDGKSYYTNSYVYYLRVYKEGRVSYLLVDKP